MKNPFKLSAIVDTVTNVGIGGAAKVAMDYAKAQISAPEWLTDNVYNAIKIGVGALGGSMTKNKYLRAAVDGIATVGAANLINDLINNSDAAAPAGLPQGTIGRIGRRGLKLGQRGFRKVSGVGAADFMGC